MCNLIILFNNYFYCYYSVHKLLLLLYYLNIIIANYIIYIFVLCDWIDVLYMLLLI